MKPALVFHNYILQRFQQCESEEGKQQLALTYFTHDAPIVNEQMKAALQRIDELEMRIKQLEGERE